MSTAVFVALQCCQCSTMQVKQRKKSSNKWTCVVCNQKQSVLKVFAQGPMAKDIRKFVQSFNLSRKFTDQNQHSDPTSEYDINFENDDGDGPENQRKRRIDWTEYLDPEDHRDRGVVSQEEGNSEPKIVTELVPKEKFKRPKLKNYGNGEGGDHQLFKPVFSKRNSRKFSSLSADEKPRKQQQAMDDIGGSASKRSGIAVGIGDETMRDCKSATANGNSKWMHYITQDDDDDEEEDFGLCGRRNSADHHIYNWSDAVLETESKYQMVEDDIHPDFM